MADAHEYGTYVALGDSFTEGVGDPDPQRPNGLRGWADRAAEQLGAHRAEFRYANLAVRGKLLDQVIDDQLQPALDLNPDLVTIHAGGNDLLRPSIDLDALMDRYDAALGSLAETGARVVVFTSVDVGRAPLFRAIRGRAAIFNELLREIADRRGLTIMDFWRLSDYADSRMWDTDRLHMSVRGHTQMAAEVLDLLEVQHSIDLDPLPLSAAVPSTDRRKDDLRWAREFLGPWVMRRVRGTSSGDNVSPRWPQPTAPEKLVG